MAKLKEINVNVKLVKNIGNYQSVTFEAGATLEIEEQDKETEAYRQAFDMVKQEINKQWEAFSKN